MPEIQSLKPVGLREAWPDEARHFTPWLATNIERLGGKLDLRLEAVQVEVTLPGAGRVDICAKQAETGARVVIENQLEHSDDSHCLRLLGYAANAEASILVWVAHSFSTYHRRILEWLNEADTIDVYAVTVRAYRVGEALAADFQTVVEPPQSRPGPSPGARKTTTTLYGEFYRPLVARLRRNGVQPVGKGGWRGRWRTFQTGHADAIYGTGVDERKARVFLKFRGTAHRDRFRALLQHREEIDGKVEGTLSWRDENQGGWKSTVVLEREAAFSLTGSEEDLETTRKWVVDNLLALRDAVQPYLDLIMGAEEGDPDDGDDADAPE